MKNSASKNAIADIKCIMADKEYLSMMLIIAAQGFLSGVISPVFPLWLTDQYNVSMGELFYVLALSGIGTTILNLIAGKLSDRYGKRKAYFQLTILLAVVRNIVFSFAPPLYVVISLNWVTQISTSAVVFSIVADKVAKRPIGVAGGFVNSLARVAVSIGIAGGSPIGLFMYGSFSHNLFYIIYSFMFVLLLLAVTLLLKDDSSANDHKVTDKPDRKGVQNLQLTLLLLLAIVLIYCGNQSINTILVLIVSEKYGTAALAGLLSYSTCLEISLYIVSGTMLDKYGYKKALVFGVSIGALYYVLLAVSQNMVQLYCIQVLGVVQTSFIFIAMMTVTQKLFATEISYANSLFFSSLIIASTVSNIYVGVMSEFGTQLLLFSIAIVMLIGLTVVYTIVRKESI